MTLSQEMHELTEQKTYNFDNFKTYMIDQMKYEANNGNYHMYRCFNGDRERSFVKHNRKLIVNWLQDEGFKTKISRFATMPEVRINW